MTAAAVFTLMALMFLDFTGTLHPWFGWLVKTQIVPAVLAVNVAALFFLALLTILFGRVYCSVICPLGITQDCVSNISGRHRRNLNRFCYKAPKTWLRCGMLALFVAALVGGISVIVSLLDPYAGFGRIASNLFAPLYRLGNNFLAWFAEAVGSYAFYSTDVWLKGWTAFSVAVLTLALVGILAWRNGRAWCNTICPVGALLGIVSRLSVFRTTFDADKCTNCGLCEKGCKASCIDSKNMTVDHSRCVTCFNCLENCKFGAMGYFAVFGKKKEEVPEAEPAEGQGGISRRSVITMLWSLAVANVLKAQQQPQPQKFQPLLAEGGLAKLKDKKVPSRKTPIVPPGAHDLSHMENNCSACQLCVSSCPNGVLRPSNRPAMLMQPEMSFERGYCRPECVECSQLCPTNAIGKITKAEKTAISIGYVVWDKSRCLVNTDNVPCVSCERRCPTEAITLVDRDPGVANSLKVPVINNELCTGCGACEYYCPVRPLSAIHVEGHAGHRLIQFEDYDGYGKRKQKK
jgi:ferredoxin